MFFIPIKNVVQNPAYRAAAVFYFVSTFFSTFVSKNIFTHKVNPVFLY